MVNHIYNDKKISGIIFDLDGTLIKSVVDFPKMKRRMIEYIEQLKVSESQYTEQQTTNEIILDLNRNMIQKKIKPDVRDNFLANLISHWLFIIFNTNIIIILELKLNS